MEGQARHHQQDLAPPPKRSWFGRNKDCWDDSPPQAIIAGSSSAGNHYSSKNTTTHPSSNPPPTSVAPSKAHRHTWLYVVAAVLSILCVGGQTLLMQSKVTFRYMHRETAVAGNYDYSYYATASPSPTKRATSPAKKLAPTATGKHLLASASTRSTGTIAAVEREQLALARPSGTGKLLLASTTTSAMTRDKVFEDSSAATGTVARIPLRPDITTANSAGRTLLGSSGSGSGSDYNSYGSYIKWNDWSYKGEVIAKAPELVIAAACLSLVFALCLLVLVKCVPSTSSDYACVAGTEVVVAVAMAALWAASLGVSIKTAVVLFDARRIVPRGWIIGNSVAIAAEVLSCVVWLVLMVGGSGRLSRRQL